MLPYPQFSFFHYGLESGNLSFDRQKLAMVNQLSGSQAKAEIEKLLVSFLQLFGQFLRI
jgi:hypothetical protein